MVKNGKPFLLRVEGQLLYVDRTHNLWALGENGKYKLPRGPISALVTIAPPKVTNKNKVKKVKPKIKRKIREKNIE